MWKMSGAQTYPTVQRLEAEIGGHLHVGAAQGEDAQAEIQQLQRQQGSPGVALLRDRNWVTVTGSLLQIVHTSHRACGWFTPSLSR